MQRIFKLIAPLVMLLVVLAACGGGTSNNTTNTGPSSSGNPARANIKFYVITHGQASDPFWSVVKKGVDQAAHDMGVQAIYEAPPTFDMVPMSPRAWECCFTSGRPRNRLALGVVRKWALPVSNMPSASTRRSVTPLLNCAARALRKVWRRQAARLLS